MILITHYLGVVLETADAKGTNEEDPSGSDGDSEHDSCSGVLSRCHSRPQAFTEHSCHRLQASAGPTTLFTGGRG